MKLSTVGYCALASFAGLASFADADSASLVPYWSAPFLDPLVPYGGTTELSNTTWTRLYFATPEIGTYNHAAMIAYVPASPPFLIASWKNSPENEDQPGQRVLYATSMDGDTWTPTDGNNVLFPPMNSTQNPTVHLFAEPFIFAPSGNVYAAASPIQYCLYPDAYQYVLLLRQVNSDLSLGPLFWAVDTIPSGYEEASAAANVVPLTNMSAQIQSDINSMTPTSTVPPCPQNGTTKCEFCSGGCQNWTIPLSIPGIENERTHYKIPQSNDDMILYRSHNNTLWSSYREDGGSWSYPIQTNITDDVSNINSGVLPDGRVYLISNAMINIFRDPIFLSTTVDGVNFNSTHAIGSCSDSTFVSPGQPWGCLYRYQGGAKEGGLQYPQGMAVTDPALEGMYAIVSLNKEDIWVSRTPFSAIP